MKSLLSANAAAFLRAALFLVVTMVSLLGCHHTPKQRPAAGFDSPGIKQILVLPFRNMTQIYGENVSVRSPISGNVFVTDTIEQNAENLLTRLLSGGVSNIEYYELIPAEQAEGALALNSKDNVDETDERFSIIRVGRELNADAVLVGHLYRFKDRIGNKYAVDSAASVAFDLNMISTHNGKLLWSGHFDETQEPLTENLFLLGTFLKRKGTWVTAEQMAAMALDELIQEMPKPQLEP